MESGLHYPHEVEIERRTLKERLTSPEVSTLIQGCRLGYQHIVATIKDRGILQSQQKFQEFTNGPVGAEVLSNKFQFGLLTRELGYTSPATVLISQETNGDEIERTLCQSQIANEKTLFVKPLDTVRGRDARVMQREMVPVQLHNETRPYLVQEFHKPEEDWRVVLHRTPSELRESGSGQDLRIAYKKVRPTVVQNNNRNTVRQLIASSDEIPDQAKAKLFRVVREELLCSIPNRGEIVELIESGNIAKGAYGMLPKTEELASMDRLLLRFRSDIESKLGVQLATLCVDVGVLDTEVLLNSPNEEELKKAVTFYEQQMPFGLSGYFKNIPIPNQEGASRLLPSVLWKYYFRFKSHRELLFSLINSGRLANRNKEN